VWRERHPLSHPGSYFGALSLQTAAADQLSIQAGDATQGFQALTFNGEAVKVEKGVQLNGAKLKLQILSSHQVLIDVDNYRLRVENSDLFVNLISVEVKDFTQLIQRDQPHGLLGQSWKPSMKARQASRDPTAVVSVKDVAEGDVDDYIIVDDQLFGTNFPFNKFNKQ